MTAKSWNVFIPLGLVTIVCFTSSVNGNCQPNGAKSPNPSNCSTYFECDHGKTLVRPCPGGLHFNPRSQVCDWPASANCGVQVLPPPQPQPTPECFSCSYIQGKLNQSNAGCELDPPSRKYLRSDCYGFGNLQIAGGYRHTAGLSHNAPSAYHHQNTHCVKISGRTDSGDMVIMRGCEDFVESNQTFSTWNCFSRREYDFPLPGMGMVRNVQKCYCKGKSCNGSPVLRVSNIFSLLVFCTTVFGKL